MNHQRGRRTAWPNATAGPPTPAEFEALYQATASELFAYLRRRGAADPEDLVAEIYAIAWRRRAELPAAPARRAWLFGTARRLLLADARRQTQQQEVFKQHLAAAECSALPNDHDAWQSWEQRLTLIVTSALERLPQADREILRLTEWERLSTAEIAVVFGITQTSARVRLHRARRRLAADPQLRELLTRRPCPTGTAVEAYD